MAVRVRLEIKSRCTERTLEVVVLLNSGFETETPQLLVPIAVAEKLGLWPSLPEDYSVALFPSC